HHDVPATDEETQALLRRAIRYNREEDIEVGAQSVQFGLASLAPKKDFGDLTNQTSWGSSI
ncbi:hypothetical protein KU626_23905, partial [Salmonella enterica subsp. enterica serovar Mbandaka]|nr:hypothetical protein [Salmonella enterica subsp. enterica serovar Mbandaka]